MTRFVLISDTHGMHDSVIIPPGDILIHAGDIGVEKYPISLFKFNSWMSDLPHKHKIVIPGNHDIWIENNLTEARNSISKFHFLICESVTVEGFKIWGTPHQPEFFDWAWNLPRGPRLAKIWAQIPEDTDVVVTHGPPAGILDLTSHKNRMGCQDLLERLNIVHPKLHVFGHNHEGYGIQTVGKTTYVNASSCTAKYRPINPPIVLDLEK